MGLSAWLAQLVDMVEHLICKYGVAGSSSVSGTRFPPKFTLLLIIEHFQVSTWKMKLKNSAKNSTGLQIENMASDL